MHLCIFLKGIKGVFLLNRSLALQHFVEVLATTIQPPILGCSFPVFNFQSYESHGSAGLYSVMDFAFMSLVSPFCVFDGASLCFGFCSQIFNSESFLMLIIFAAICSYGPNRPSAHRTPIGNDYSQLALQAYDILAYTDR